MSKSTYVEYDFAHDLSSLTRFMCRRHGKLTTGTNPELAGVVVVSASSAI
jgi:hypothetical protein